MNTPNRNLDSLREKLFDLLDGVKSGEIALDKARVLNEIGKTLIATAAVEVDYLKASGGGESSFIPAAGDDSATPDSKTPGIPGKPASPLPTGITGITRHRLQG